MHGSGGQSLGFRVSAGWVQPERRCQAPAPGPLAGTVAAPLAAVRLLRRRDNLPGSRHVRRTQGHGHHGACRRQAGVPPAAFPGVRGGGETWLQKLLPACSPGLDWGHCRPGPGPAALSPLPRSVQKCPPPPAAPLRRSAARTPQEEQFAAAVEAFIATMQQARGGACGQGCERPAQCSLSQCHTLHAPTSSLLTSPPGPEHTQCLPPGCTYPCLPVTAPSACLVPTDAGASQHHHRGGGGAGHHQAQGPGPGGRRRCAPWGRAGDGGRAAGINPACTLPVLHVPIIALPCSSAGPLPALTRCAPPCSALAGVLQASRWSGPQACWSAWAGGTHWTASSRSSLVGTMSARARPPPPACLLPALAAAARSHWLVGRACRRAAVHVLRAA